MPLPFAAWAGVATGAAVQRASGLGFSLVCVPFLVLVHGPHDGVRIANTLAIGLNLAVLIGERRGVLWREVGLLLVPALVVAVPAGILARRLNTRPLQLVAGALMLVAVVAVARRPQEAPPKVGLRGAAGLAVAGGTSALGNVLAGIGGPAVATYGVAQAWAPDAFRGTLNAYFLGLNVLSLAVLGLPGLDAGAAAGLVAWMAAGFLVGGRLAGRLTAAHVRTFVLVIASAGAATTIARALL